MPTTKTARLIWGFLFFSWSITIIILTLIPDEELVKLGVDNSGFRWDYVHHLSAFLMFSLLFLLWRSNDPNRKRLILVLLVGLIFASLTEFSQIFIPSRNFNYIDLLFNLAGIPGGILSASLLNRIKPAAI